ncbi:ClbS/DfsB family four-helix bundle protein, partial [Ruminococcaceae bacterium OttesenSCG-928-A16]|nr:ClbS/DfsB family four-helix bundle protein [Ruminococcaceae bacterium OttesenSCG-928-A16]
PPPYNWKNYGDMNVDFWQNHQTTSLDDAKALLLGSHKDVLALIENFTNDELFKKEHFNWSGTTNIGSYFVSATASHYNWAIKKLKRQIKALR